MWFMWSTIAPGNIAAINPDEAKTPLFGLRNSAVTSSGARKARNTNANTTNSQTIAEKIKKADTISVTDEPKPL